MIDMPDDREPILTIGVAAGKLGVSESTLRLYEREGLLIAHRTDSGYRLFSHEDIDRVRNIQHLIQDLGLNIEGIRRMQALLPCWELLPCSNQDRQGCPAQNDGSRPCWTIKGLPCAPKGNECRRCAVYRFGSLCTQDIKRLLFEGNGLKNGASAKLERLVQIRLRGEPISGNE